MSKYLAHEIRQNKNFHWNCCFDFKNDLFFFHFSIRSVLRVRIELIITRRRCIQTFWSMNRIYRLLMIFLFTFRIITTKTKIFLFSEKYYRVNNIPFDKLSLIDNKRALT